MPQRVERLQLGQLGRQVRRRVVDGQQSGLAVLAQRDRPGEIALDDDLHDRERHRHPRQVLAREESASYFLLRQVLARRK
jgi:hypothetical protein